MNLKRLGWGPDFHEAFERDYGGGGLSPARVVREEREAYLLCDGNEEVLAQVSGRFRHLAGSDGEFPAVGDWVAAAVRPGEGRATIHGVLPRRSRLSRDGAGERTVEQVLAANVDTAFLVSGLDGDFNLRRLERYLTLVYDSGATPVVVLNKADLCPDVPARVAAVETVAFGVAIVALTAATGEGLAALRKHLSPGRTAVLLGSSGVGKSTLINRLTGSDERLTGHVRAGDGRGRHTTTHRELIVLADGAMVIDTPGLRELQLWADDEAGEAAFADIAELAKGCRFRDCSHVGEPGCAVQQALADGRLDVRRYENFLQLQKELRHLAGRKDARIREAERAKWRQIALLQRRFKQDRRRER